MEEPLKEEVTEVTKEEEFVKTKEFAELSPELQKYYKDLRNEAADNRKKLTEYQSKEEEAKALLLADNDKKELELKTQLAKKGEYEELWKGTQVEINELKKIKLEYDKIQTDVEAERQTLLKKLPNEKRELYKDVSIKIVKDILETFEKSKLDTSAGLNNPTGEGGGIDWSKMNDEQINGAIQNNSANYADYEKYIFNK